MKLVIPKHKLPFRQIKIGYKRSAQYFKVTLGVADQAKELVWGEAEAVEEVLLLLDGVFEWLSLVQGTTQNIVCLTLLLFVFDRFLFF